MPNGWDEIADLTIEEAWERLAYKPNPEGPPRPVPPLPRPLRRFKRVRVRRPPAEIIDPAMWWWLEPPEFCPGPPPAYATWFSMAPELATLAPGRFRPNFGPVFWRGRLDGSARLLVVGQDPSSDEQLARRCFVGRAGQRLQGLLTKLGLSGSYVIVNVFHYGIVGQYDSALEALSADPTVLAWRNGLLDKLIANNPIQAILTAGAAARDAVDLWPGAAARASDRIHIWHPTALDEDRLLASWNAALPELGSRVTPDVGESQDLSPYGTSFTDPDHHAIPRRDLPYGIPAWHGAGGATRSTRQATDAAIVWTAPA